MLFACFADLLAFADVPLDGAVELLEDFVEEGDAGEDAGALGEEAGGGRGVADDEAAVVEARRVFVEPGRHGAFPGLGEQVGGIAVDGGAFGDGHCAGCRGCAGRWVLLLTAWPVCEGIYCETVRELY